MTHVHKFWKGITRAYVVLSSLSFTKAFNAVCGRTMYYSVASQMDSCYLLVCRHCVGPALLRLFLLASVLCSNGVSLLLFLYLGYVLLLLLYMAILCIVLVLLLLVLLLLQPHLLPVLVVHSSPSSTGNVTG